MSPPILHRDLKSANILIALSSGDAQVCNHICNHICSHICNHICNRIPDEALLSGGAPDGEGRARVCNHICQRTNDM